MFCISMWCSDSDYTDDRRHALTGMHNDCTEIKLGGGDIYGHFCLPKWLPLLVSTVIGKSRTCMIKVY